MKRRFGMRWLVLLIGLAPGVAGAQSGNLFTENQYMEAPAVRRDRQWLKEYLDTNPGTAAAPDPRVNEQLNTMSPAQVRMLVRFYQQREHLEQARQNAWRDQLYQDNALLTETQDREIRAEEAYNREKEDLETIRQYQWNVARQAAKRPGFNAFNYQPFSFDLLQFDYGVYFMNPSAAGHVYGE